jgi:hypothetical protein
MARRGHSIFSVVGAPKSYVPAGSLSYWLPFWFLRAGFENRVALNGNRPNTKGAAQTKVVPEYTTSRNAIASKSRSICGSGKQDAGSCLSRVYFARVAESASFAAEAFIRKTLFFTSLAFFKNRHA